MLASGARRRHGLQRRTDPDVSLSIEDDGGHSAPAPVEAAPRCEIWTLGVRDVSKRGLRSSPAGRSAWVAAGRLGASKLGGCSGILLGVACGSECALSRRAC